MQVRKAVIPAAGLGTRLLPVTSAVPKELLPVVDCPAIEHIIEEASASGIEEIIVVVSPTKGSMVDYLRRSAEPGHANAARNHHAACLGDTAPHGRPRFVFEVQREALGLGHAVLTAQPCVGDEPFAVMLPDDLVDAGRPLLGDLIEVAKHHGGSVVAVQEVPDDMVSRYGIVGGCQMNDRVVHVDKLVEKPAREAAPSNLAIVGRYVFTPDLFAFLANTPKGVGGEIQLTDAMKSLVTKGTLYAYKISGRRYDTGTPLGLLEASLGYALKRPGLRSETISLLRRMIDQAQSG